MEAREGTAQGAQAAQPGLRSPPPQKKIPNVHQKRTLGPLFPPVTPASPCAVGTSLSGEARKVQTLGKVTPAAPGSCQQCQPCRLGLGAPAWRAPLGLSQALPTAGSRSSRGNGLLSA